MKAIFNSNRLSKMLKQAIKNSEELTTFEFRDKVMFINGIRQTHGDFYEPIEVFEKSYSQTTSYTTSQMGYLVRVLDCIPEQTVLIYFHSENLELNNIHFY